MTTLLGISDVFKVRPDRLIGGLDASIDRKQSVPAPLSHVRDLDPVLIYY